MDRFSVFSDPIQSFATNIFIEEQKLRVKQSLRRMINGGRHVRSVPHMHTKPQCGVTVPSATASSLLCFNLVDGLDSDPVCKVTRPLSCGFSISPSASRELAAPSSPQSLSSPPSISLLTMLPTCGFSSY